ncbi:MAG: peptide-methionine (R)-S-oxide reductase MsrB [Wenzhouxiangella sp.]|nr:peptide-methionine (R)-S-oxide reductase MsrB [Wenzhouxiangella sp.]TVR92234.1 MAG: peptide-methionine (R)-S-oxide reductase [Wenzhouxiangellaceae bacterium]
MESDEILRSRRRLLLRLGIGLPVLGLFGGRILADTEQALPFEPLELTARQWRDILSAEEYRVLRREGTERAFSSPLDKEYGDGTYVCAGCFLPLFSSAHKYDSGTGWPSFWQPINDQHIGTKRDFRLFIPRTEYHCARCGGHQGHVFDDGPEPTGQRWCNNGVALRFVPAGTDLPALRMGVEA